MEKKCTVSSILLVAVLILSSCKDTPASVQDKNTESKLQGNMTESTIESVIIENETKTLSSAKITQETDIFPFETEIPIDDPNLVKQLSHYKYQPPQEVKNARFYAKDIDVEIKFNDYIPENYSWEHFDEEGYRQKLLNEFYKRYPKEIVDDMDCSIIPYDGVPINQTDYKIVCLGDMRYDMNSDGVQDYIMHAWISLSGGMDIGNDLYKIYLSQKDNTYKAVYVPTMIHGYPLKQFILKTKTKGLNDLLLLSNGNDPVASYDGDSSYTGCEYLEEKCGTAVGVRQVNGTMAECSGKLVCRPDDKQCYVAAYFKNNPYFKENILYSCNPDGTPKAMENYSFVFYAELKEGVTIPENCVLTPDEFRYFPVTKE